VSDFQKRQHNAQEEILELKEENAQLKLKNDIYQEKLRSGIKRATIFTRDTAKKNLAALSFNRTGVECLLK
jgi:hypothetical protein